MTVVLPEYRLMKATVEIEKMDRYKADPRGRITLGSEFADKTVEVAILGVVEDSDDGEQADDLDGHTTRFVDVGGEDDDR